MNHVVPVRRAGFVLAAACAALTVCAAEDVTTPAPTHGIIQLSTDGRGLPARSGNSNSALSLNWSGYVLPNFSTATNYTSAQAAWSVPAVSYRASLLEQKILGSQVPELSSTWVGIGGYCAVSNCSQRDSTLIQLGTSQEAVAPGVSAYYAWYEMLPATPVVIPKLVSAGDSITASLTCADPCTPSTSQSWTLSMSDTTRGWQWTTTVQYTSPLLSAEWILEAPLSTSYGILPLPNYTLQMFNPVSANGSGPSLAPADSVTMIDVWGETSNPSAPTGDAFNTCWSAGLLPASCTAPGAP